MEFFQTLVSEYLLELFGILITAFAGYLGMAIKRLYAKYVTSHEKAEVVEICVRATEQVYRALSGEEKLAKATESCLAMLAERKISVSETELRMLIESAVLKFREALAA